MKNILILFLLACFSQPLFAQQISTGGNALPKLYIKRGISLHLRSPEEITYIDTSFGLIKADLPLPALLRIRVNPDSSDKGFSSGVITIAAQSFIAQYQVCLVDETSHQNVQAEKEILWEETLPISPSPYSLSPAQIRTHAGALLAKRNGHVIKKVSANGITMSLKGVYSVADLIFLDLEVKNKSKLSYDIDELALRVNDKKIVRSTNQQAISIPILFSLNEQRHFTSSYRNVLVFRKATFASYKNLEIALSEKQLSARSCSLKLSYQQVLRADSF